MTRRPFRPLAWLPTLGLWLLTGPLARAQEVVEGGGGESSGNPLPGYLVTAFIGAAAIFVLCKSARR